MIRGVHFLDIEQDAPVTDYVMSQVVHIMDSNIITNITGDDEAVSNSRGHSQIVVLEGDVAYAADPVHSEKPGVFDLVRVKLIGYIDILPVFGGVVVIYQSFHFVYLQVPPARFRGSDLFVSLIVFIMIFGKVIRGNEVLPNVFPGYN
jgi:hypothetical protein